MISVVNTTEEEKLIETIQHHFCDVLIVLIWLYLEKNEPFTITTEIVQNIIQGIDDRMIKLKYYDNIVHMH